MNIFTHYTVSMEESAANVTKTTAHEEITGGFNLAIFLAESRGIFDTYLINVTKCFQWFI